MRLVSIYDKGRADCNIIIDRSGAASAVTGAAATTTSNLVSLLN